MDTGRLIEIYSGSNVFKTLGIADCFGLHLYIYVTVLNIWISNSTETVYIYIVINNCMHDIFKVIRFSLLISK